MEPWVVTLLVAVAGWIGTVVVAVIAYSHDQGRKAEKIDSIVKQHEEDRAENLKRITEAKSEMQAAVFEFRAMLFTPEGRPVLMSVHDCRLTQTAFMNKLDDIKDMVKANGVRAEKSDDEVFKRLRAVESQLDRLAPGGMRDA